MRIIGCDLHASQQSIAMLDDQTGEITERTLRHEGDTVRAFYAALPHPVVVGIEATGSMGWFLRLMEDLAISCQVGHPAKIRATEARRQKHDRRDARLLLDLLSQDRFPSIWMPSGELRDLRALLLHRDQWVRFRTRVMNALQGIALGEGLRRGARLWSRTGQAVLTALPLKPYAADRRAELQNIAHTARGSHRAAESSRACRSGRPPGGAPLDDAPWRGARHRAGNRSLLRRSDSVSRRESGCQLRGADSERVLKWSSTATRTTHETGQSLPSVSLVRSGHARGSPRRDVTPLLSTQTPTERCGQGSSRRRAQTGHPTMDPDARSDRLR
jgi:Transposase